MSPVTLSFKSEVAALPDEVWKHITSIKFISREMKPYLRMTAPEGIENLASVDVALGEPLFRSRLFLFGFFPIGHSLLTLVELQEGVGFIEESPMSWMKLWRHERRIAPAGRGSIVSDHLTFQPVLAVRIAVWFVRVLFNHRHAVLRRQLTDR